MLEAYMAPDDQVNSKKIACMKFFVDGFQCLLSR